MISLHNDTLLRPPSETETTEMVLLFVRRSFLRLNCDGNTIVFVLGHPILKVSIVCRSASISIRICLCVFFFFQHAFILLLWFVCLLLFVKVLCQTGGRVCVLSLPHWPIVYTTARSHNRSHVSTLYVPRLPCPSCCD